MVCPYSLTLPGGVQGQVMSLSRALTKRGIEVRILGPCDGPPPDTSITPLGSSLPTASNGSIVPIAPDPSAVFRTIRALRDERFDVIHIHEPLCPGPSVTALLAKPAPLVGTFHAAGAQALYTPYKLLKSILKPISLQLDVRCAVSVTAAKHASQVVEGDFKILFNGIDIENYQQIEPVPNEFPTIFFLGRHDPRKGLKTLVHAMKELPSDVRLQIGGEGPETNNLMNETANDPRIKWLGRISSESKRSHLANADLFCVPSLSGESFGVVLLEAMAAGTPIVASEIDGYTDVARKDMDAVLVPPGNPHALAESILKVLGDKKLNDSLIKSASKRAEDFSMAKLAEAYEEIYSQCMKPNWQRVTS